MVRLLSLLGAAALSIGIACAGDVPRPAPALSVKTPGGDQVSLESLRGKVVLLEFFLTDCPHCQRTAATIVSVYKDWKPRGLEVLAVAINPDALQKIPEFVQRFNINFPIALGNSPMVKSFADISAVKNFFVPYIFLIDRRGVIRFEHGGDDAAFYQNEAVNLRAEADKLLKEPATSHKAAPKTSRKTS